MELKSLATGVGFVKAGFLGFNKSGKTFTAVELALAIRKHCKLDGPIAFFDTEASAQYVAPRIRKETMRDLVGHSSRALADAVEFLRACKSGGVSVAIIDSVTHLWRELCDSYLKQRNKALAEAGRNPRTRLEFQDWGPIKAKWATFSDLYLNSQLHVIICGRAGYEYDYEENEDGKKDLVKTGIKMKTEGEFGFEPSLLIQMERIQVDETGRATGAITHRATVIGDRFGVIDGRTADNPTGEFFAPYLALLRTGAHASVDTTASTPMDVDGAGDAEWQREKRQRVIFCEEAIGLMTSAYPGQSAADKQAKTDLIALAWGTRSWTAVENMESKRIKTGLDALPGLIERYRAEKAKAAEEAPAAEAKGTPKPGKPRLVAAGKGGDA